MEKVIAQEEKIRRAQEIYERRRNNGYNYDRRARVTTVNVNEQKKYGLFKKMFLQIAICLVIYFIFYLIQNSNYVFSQDFLEKTKQILSYDIDISSIYTQTVNFITQQMQGITKNQENDTILQNEVDSNTIDENVIDNAIGGAEIENVLSQAVTTSSDETKEEPIQTDEEYIKSNFSFIKPVQGIVSSEFGQRDVDNPIVSKNHTGIDIAANKGTVIYAAMEGTVTVSSTQGDYGYHIKITNQDVSTLYGHCSKLYVKQGETIKQGQAIAQVGSTGKSTRTTFTF